MWFPIIICQAVCLTTQLRKVLHATIIMLIWCVTWKITIILFSYQFIISVTCKLYPVLSTVLLNLKDSLIRNLNFDIIYSQSRCPKPAEHWDIFFYYIHLWCTEESHRFKIKTEFSFLGEIYKWCMQIIRCVQKSLSA